MKAYINKNGVKNEIIKIYETYNGDLYFLTEKPNEEGYTLAYARLYAMPEFAEWGDINIPYLESNQGYGKLKIWEVKKPNWHNINSYEKDLLEFQSEKRKVVL